MARKVFPEELRAAREDVLRARRAWQRLKRALGYCLSDACTEKHETGWCALHRKMRPTAKRDAA